MMTPKPSVLRCVAVVAVVTLCVHWRSAVASAADTVEVQVWSIRATHQDQTISPELKELAQALKKAFKFKGYRLLEAKTQAAKLGKATVWKLPGAYKLTATPKEITADKIRLEVVVTRRKGERDVKTLTTTVALKPGKFQLFGGWKLEGEDVLILAVSAK